jgi:hypothetical protein
MVQGDPIGGSNFPIVPPVPLIPPSLFGVNPSAPEMRDPRMRNHWQHGIHDRLGHGLRGGDYLTNPHLYDRNSYGNPYGYTGRNSLLYGGLGEYDEKKLRKRAYGFDLEDQIAEKRYRQADDDHKRRLQEEVEDLKRSKDRYELSWRDHNYGDHPGSRRGWGRGWRRDRYIDDYERDDKRIKSHWHHRDEDRWNYKRYRKPKELVDGSYIDNYWGPGPQDGRKHPHWDMHPGKEHPWWHMNRDKNWQHPSWWETKDPYGPPPGAGDKNWWWHGN